MFIINYNEFLAANFSKLTRLPVSVPGGYDLRPAGKLRERGSNALLEAAREADV